MTVATRTGITTNQPTSQPTKETNKIREIEKKKIAKPSRPQLLGYKYPAGTSEVPVSTQGTVFKGRGSMRVYRTKSKEFLRAKDYA